MSKKTPVKFKKRSVPGQCRAMRCKESKGLTEIGTYGDDPSMVLCDPHLERVNADRAGGPPPAVDDKPVPMIGTDEASGDPIYSLDGGDTWAFGDPPEPEPEKPEVLRDVDPEGKPIESHDGGDTWAFTEAPGEPPASTTVVVEHTPVLALVGPMRDEYTGMGEKLVGFVIDNQAGVDGVAELLKQLKGKLKIIESERKKIVRPLLDATKAVNDLFRPATDAAKRVEGMLKGALSGFIERQQQSQVSALQVGNHTEALAVEQPVMPQGVSTRTVWNWKVTDPSLVPREYLAVDAAAVQAHVNEYKDQASIPGIEAYPETSIAARAGT